MTSLATGLPLAVLTTTGAKSGLQRTTPLLCIRDNQAPGTIALVASNWGQGHLPSWYYNLRSNPTATCSVNGIETMFEAHEAVEQEYERFWQSAERTYLGFPRYKQRAQGRNIPIMVLVPVSRATKIDTGTQGTTV